MTTHIAVERVLAIEPTTRGFGFVVLESMESAIDWGLKEARQRDRRARLVRHFCGILKRNQPEALIVEKLTDSDRGLRLQDMMVAIIDLARSEGLPVVLVARDEVRRYFASRGAGNRDEVAQLIANDFPMLSHYLPAKRKWWKSEDTRIRVLHAAAIARTFYATKKKGGQ